MKDKKKKKGGQRAGAGRKPSGRQKEAVTVYTDVSKFGGKEGARMAIYEFLNGQISLTGKSSFVPLEWPKESHEKAKKSVISNILDPKKKTLPSDREIKQNGVPLPDGYVKVEKIGAVKSDGTVIPDVTQPVPVLKPQEQPKTKFEAAISETAQKAIREQIEAIRSEKIPKERDTPFGRKSWQIDQQKRIQDLQSKLS